MAVIEEKMENQPKTKKVGLLGIFATTNGYEVRLLDETCRKPDCTGECGIGRITEARHERTAFIAAKKALVRMGYTHFALMGSRYVRRLPSYLDIARERLQKARPTGAERIEAIKKLLAEFPDLTLRQARCFVTGDTYTKPQRPQHQAAVTRRRIRLLVEGIRAHAAEEGISLEGFEKVTTLKQFSKLAHHVEWTFNDRARKQWVAFHAKVEAGLEPFYKEHPEARPTYNGVYY
jgi:hypothetical protein